MALLQSKPAPLYILNGIDAALDFTTHRSYHPHTVFESPLYRRVVDRQLVFPKQMYSSAPNDSIWSLRVKLVLPASWYGVRA
ncbi:hypothetical protein BDP27DRAFT_1059911 [Rhodocollybia butyracea]|uniref:Uncharacterized protein n=1 Tax=Rhodocollybia butyracea TaxID=206335 RepID=A0A9P5PP17_9AGAR|nr:hypothetical protein BDP27DRAFT_1059911 [Rhodocollybia butyracea]